MPVIGILGGDVRILVLYLRGLGFGMIIFCWVLFPFLVFVDFFWCVVLAFLLVFGCIVFVPKFGGSCWCGVAVLR